MKFLYLFLRICFQSSLTVGEAWQEAIDIIEYEERNPGHTLVRPLENPNDIPEMNLYEGPEEIIGPGIFPICKKR